MAREVLGLNPWACVTVLGADGRAEVVRTWWAADSKTSWHVVPLSLPAGRLVAEWWFGNGGDHTASWVHYDSLHGSKRSGAAGLHAACLYRGDLLRVCSALGVEVPAGTVPRLDYMHDLSLARACWSLEVANVLEARFAAQRFPGEGVRLVPALAGGADPRAALDAIVKEVCGG